MEPVISVNNFSKAFGRKKAVTDLSFSVENKEIFAFLGANGSGKTTTIRALLGISAPDTGSLLINGKKYSTKESSFLGYLPEERGLYLSSGVLETMIYFGELKGLNGSEAKKIAENYLKRVDLADKKEIKIKKLSSGQQQKIQLGITIINSPKLLILDEPTKGLDPINRELLLDILKELNQKGSTIMFSTHQLEEAEKIASSILIIKKGKREVFGNINNIKKEFGTNVISLQYSGELKENTKLFSARISKNFAEITPNDGISSDQILRYLVDLDTLNIESFKIGTPSLNEIFIRVSA